MSTDTNDLIAKLSGDLKPVKRLAPVWARAALLSAVTLAAVFGCIFAFTKGIRADWQVLFGPHLCQINAIFFAGVLSAFAAFTLSVPDTKIRPHVYGMIGLASAIWGIIILEEVVKGVPAIIPTGPVNCVSDLGMLSVVPFVFAVFMSTRAAPVWRGWTGYSLMLSVCSFAALGMRFICPNEDPGHLLVWHFLPVLVLAGFGILLGEILLRWKVAKI